MCLKNKLLPSRSIYVVMDGSIVDMDTLTKLPYKTMSSKCEAKYFT